MKKLLLSAGIFLTGVAFAQKANPLADTLMYLYGISANSFDELHPLHRGVSETLPLHILGADEVMIYDGGMLGYELWLRYSKSNPLGPDMEKQFMKFMSKLENGKDWTFRRIVKADPAVLLYKNVPRFQVYDHPARDPNLFDIEIKQAVPSMPVLASEAAYHGKYPATFIPGDVPQIVQLSGKGATPDSYIRWNGIFGNQGLQKGSITIRGYNDYFDGEWISKDWHPVTRGGIQVIFMPANTKDTIYGKLADTTLQDFLPDNRYSGYVGNKYYPLFVPGAPVWLENTWLNFRSDTEKEERARREKEAAAASVWNPRATYNSPVTQENKPYVKSLCSCCSGRGYKIVYTTSEYQKKDQYGTNQGIGTHYINVSCSCCGGSGYR